MSGKSIWFPAKRYGWGWGLPLTWQGWLLIAMYFILLSAGTFVFQPDQRPISYVVYTAVLSLILIGICWLKGEPPRWRWGEK